MTHTRRLHAAVLLSLAALSVSFFAARADVVDVRVVTAPMSPAITKYRAEIVEGRPGLRGYKAPILSARAQLPPINEPAVGAPAEERAAAEFVAKHLATDGLLYTVAQALAMMPPPPPNSARDPLSYLTRIGVPIDLLNSFDSGAQRPDNMSILVERIDEMVANGVKGNDLRDAVNAMFPFNWRRADTSYRVASESGEHDLAMLRMQMTRGDDWQAENDGGNLDLFRHLLRAAPQTQFLVSVERTNSEPFVRTLRTMLTPETAGHVIVFEEPVKLTQWAGDNGKAGWVREPGVGRTRLATLAPRYASRGEDGSSFVPGDSFLMDGLASAGHMVIQSSLLFQGGNLLAATDPATGKRLLLVGESEIYRNTALGLSREQTEEAFRLEFDVDRVIVLPSISFHIDYEVSLRAHNGKLLAFVNDSQPAIQYILYAGTGALERAGLIDADAANTTRKALEEGRIADVLGGPVGNVVLGSQQNFGQFPESLAKAFALGPADSHVGNFRVFLLAMDMAASFLIPDDQLPPEAHPRAYLKSFKRREADRAALHKQLADLGFTVVPIPSLSDEARSINAINGIHDRTRYFMPAWGGLYSLLDEAAARAIRAQLGDDVKVIPINSAESQRRVGAVHCSAAAYYDPAQGPAAGVPTP